MNLREILFGKKPAPPPPPVTETVTLGWVVRVQFTRNHRPRSFWSTLFDDREYAETLFEEWSSKVHDLTAAASKCMVLSRIMEDGGKAYMRLTPADAYNGIRLDIHEVTEKREVKKS